MIHFAILCRPALYERLCNPLREVFEGVDILISPALSDKAMIIEYIKKHSVHSLIIESGLPQVEQFKSFPYPILLYNPMTFRQDVLKWHESLGVHIQPAPSVPTDIPKFLKSRNTAPKTATPTKPQHNVIAYCVDPSIQEAIRNDADIQLIDVQSRLTNTFSDDTWSQANILFIEESVVSKEKPDIREEKIRQILNTVPPHIKIALLLFDKHSNAFINELIDKKIYNFLCTTSPFAEDIIDLIKLDKQSHDVMYLYKNTEERVALFKELEAKSRVAADVAEDIKASVEQVESTSTPIESPPIVVQDNRVISENTEINEPSIIVHEEAEVQFNPSPLADIEVPSTLSTRSESVPPLTNIPSTEEPKHSRFRELKGKMKGFLNRPRLEQDYINKPEVELSEQEDQDVISPASESLHYLGPHRIVVYSPKGGAGATTTALAILNMYEEDKAGLVEVSYSYSQLMNKLQLDVPLHLYNVSEGMEQQAVIQSKYLCSPSIFPIHSRFDDTMLNDWLQKGVRAFSGKSIIVDLQSNSSPALLSSALQWSTRTFWVLENNEDSFGMADLQLMYIKRYDENWQKIGLIVYEGETSKKKLPWEQLELPMLGELTDVRYSKKWNQQLQQAVKQHLQHLEYAYSV